MAKNVRYPDKILKEFQRIQSHSDMSKAYLVRKSGISYSTFRNWETGKTRAPLFSTMRMALETMGYKIEVVPKRNGDNR